MNKPDVRRGEVYWVDFDPARGVEQAGRRPAMVVQNDRGNRSSSYTVVATISSAPLPREYPFTVVFGTGEANLRRPGHINCAQLLTVDLSRLGSCVGAVSADTMQRVTNALRYELGL